MKAQMQGLTSLQAAVTSTDGAVPPLPNLSDKVMMAMGGSKDFQGVMNSAMVDIEFQKKQATEKFERSGSIVHNPNSILTPVFIMKVITLPFIDGKFEMKLFAFRRKYNCFITATGEYFQPQTMKGLSKDNILSSGFEGIGVRNDFRG